MRLGVFVTPRHAVAVAREAERLGYASALAPEGFRGDAVSVLGAMAGATERIGLAAGMMQIPARTPVMTALTAATLNEIAGGRFTLGLGVSTARVSTGWYGVDFDQPLARTREYLDVVRLAVSGAPVEYPGAHHRLPDGDGEPARLRGVTPCPDLAVLLGGVGPRGIELAGEIADGWVGSFCSVDRVADAVGLIERGRARAGRSLDGFAIIPSIPVTLGEDPAPLRPYYATFLGMGGPDTNAYARLAGRMGFAAPAAEVHRLAAAGDRAAAAAAVPAELIAQTALLGDTDTIAARMARYAAAGVTTLGLTLLAPELDDQYAAMRVCADALERVDEYV